MVSKRTVLLEIGDTSPREESTYIRPSAHQVIRGFDFEMRPLW
jgi:hypothetical protein